MKSRLTVLAAVAAVSLTGLLAGPAEATTHQTREGLTIELDAAQQSVRKTQALDSSPFTGEALLSSNAHAAIGNIGDKKVKATLEIGYQVGYPVAVAKDGVDVTMHTPDLKLSAGVNAKASPEVTVDASGSVGVNPGAPEVGAEAGAESTVIPAADLNFKVEAGKVTTVDLAKIALTKPTADIVLSNVDINVSNAVGPISVRPFAKITVTSETGVYVYYAYGATTKI